MPSATPRPLRLRDELEDALESYFQERRKRIPTLIGAHFTLQGSLDLHRRVIRYDWFKHALNALTSIPGTIFRKSTSIVHGLGFEFLADRMNRLPLGLRTSYEKEIERSLTEDLFELSYRADSDSRYRAILTQLLSPPSLKRAESDRDSERKLDQFARRVDVHIRREIRSFTANRAALFDIGSSGLVLLAGYWIFHEAGLDLLDIGERLANRHARRSAASSFFLGKDAGSVFYGIFPVAPTRGEVVLATAIVLAGISFLAAFVHLLGDPAQEKLGVQQRLLEKMLDRLEPLIIAEARVFREL